MSTIATLSTMQKALNARQAIADQDRAVQNAQQEVTTGLKADVYADGSFRAAQTLDMRNRMARSDAYAVSNQLLGAKMSVMSTALGNIREVTQDFIALVTSLAEGQGAEVLQSNAKSVLVQIGAQLNTAYSGEYIFSGENGAVQSLATTEEGFAIEGLDTLLAAGDLAGAQAAIEAYFSPPANATGKTFYTENYKASDKLAVAQIDENQSISYGYTAENAGMRELLKGLAMLIAVDVDSLPSGAAKTDWLKEVTSSMSKGVSSLQAAETDLGNHEALVERMVTRQQKMGEIYNNRIVDIEGVDAYEAATRLESLATQLETSYALTVRLKNLSLLNFM